MNNQFDSPRCRAFAAGELTKSLAQSVTRHAALKKACKVFPVFLL